MGSPLTFGALADDFTGAVELAAMLRAAGARAMVHVGPGSLPDRPPEVDAIVVALRTRAAPAGEAVAISRQVAQQLRRLGARQLFLKYCATFDSLPAGNIGNVAEVLREVAGAAPVLFCPTYPEAARTVFRGHMFVGGQLLADSPKRHDPLTPMTNSNLAEVLALQTSLAVDILPYEVVAAGAAAIHTHAEACHAAGRPFLIADSILPEDLRQIAAASCDWPVMTGGASVAAYFPSLWVARGWMRPSEQPSLPGTPGPAAVLAGSCADRTREQVAAFARDHKVLDLDPLDPPEQSIARALSWASEHMAHAPVCITTSADPARVAAAQAALGSIAAGRRAEALLARIASGLVERGLRRLLVAGGETSGAIVEQLGVRSLQVAPFAAIGVGRCHADHPVPLALCLKSGKLGAVDMFATTLAAMEQPA
ncbi:MAG: hypothetical protein BGP12_16770 [Rhodospirillales bacterium 70-18]|nr:four-carbon acid sugar kinase family protein [Rhodospirillales bacterium]OJY64178.1 MAG: hypothetical protein BGP12_16770 [Rhodospirillales bacterium 70-18]